MRFVGLSATLCCVATMSTAEGVSAARYTEETTRYQHAILGDAIEYGTLIMDTADGEITVVLPQTHVFEDVAPRLVDIDGDGASEVLVVESSIFEGARVAIYDATGAVKAATPHIGRANRWYAPVGVADLDGDGLMEVAYVDRPHLAKTLRIWRYQNGDFAEVAAAAGVTNHRIGEPDIAGGIRDCGAGPEIVLASADWSQLLAVQFDGDFSVSTLGTDTSRTAFATAMACDQS
ncbi:MAG: VCBS repeat-containing protein [Pseudomonadota bacterium]